MNPKELPLLSEVTSGQVYSKAREILDLHGHLGTRPTLIVSRPGGGQRITSREDISITEAPIVPIQIADNEYRLWLRSKDDRPSDKHNGEIELSVHFQRLPYDVDRIEYDSEGYVTGYWYKPKDLPELKHLRVARIDFLPKELQFSWYVAEAYSIKPNANSTKVLQKELKYVPPEIAAGLGDSNEFLLGILEHMQTELKGKSA